MSTCQQDMKEHEKLGSTEYRIQGENEVAENMNSLLTAALRDVQTFDMVNRFVAIARHLKSEIQSHFKELLSNPPPWLPTPILAFFEASLEIEAGMINKWWLEMKDIVWHGEVRPLTDTEYGLLQQYGPRVSEAKNERFTSDVFYPPFHDCPSCKKALVEPLRYEATLFTLRRGAVAAYVASLYCRNNQCAARNTRYYPNFAVQPIPGSSVHTRVYYTGVPEVIQCDEHCLIESDLCSYFSNCMLFVWSSSLNCANLYNSSLSTPSHHRPSYPVAWPCSFNLSDRKIWHAFQIHALLNHHHQFGSTLSVPHECEQDERLRVAMRERSTYLKSYGDPTARLHSCDLCCVYIGGNEDAYNGLARLDAVVMDGVTVGHACCAVHECKKPLLSKRDQFCPEHRDQDEICRITDCQSKAERSFRSCTNPEHRAMDLANKERGQSFFQLRQRLERQKVALPNNSLGLSQETNAILDSLEEDDEDCDGKSDKGNKKIRAQWARRKTHNEQLIVRTCGVIIARQTFYGSEGMRNVKAMLQSVFRSKAELPSVLFYDNNCQLQKHIRSDPNDIEFFNNVIMPVDVFHFKSKHKVTDEFCQSHCNPCLWPDLYDAKEKKWKFNSSIAEQTNVWVGGYHSMLREMHEDNFNFFLDEMILRRNDVLISKLEQNGYGPWSGANL